MFVVGKGSTLFSYRWSMLFSVVHVKVESVALQLITVTTHDTV